MPMYHVFITVTKTYRVEIVAPNRGAAKVAGNAMQSTVIAADGKLLDVTTEVTGSEETEEETEEDDAS